MTFRAHISVATAAVSLTVLLPVSLHSQSLPLANDVVARYVAAVGGKDEIMKLTSLKQIATMELPAVGMSASMELYSAAPNLMSSTTTLPGIGAILSGFNGTVGWEVNPMQGPRLLTDKELKVMRERADFYASKLYLADRYLSMETIGDTILAGDRAYKVRMIAKASGSESVTFFSASSGLVVGGTLTQESPMGSVNATFTQSDYKRFGALLMPTKTVIVTGPQTMIMTIQDVTLDGAPVSAFAIPAQVLSLTKR